MVLVHHRHDSAYSIRKWHSTNRASSVVDAWIKNNRQSNSNPFRMHLNGHLPTYLIHVCVHTPENHLNTNLSFNQASFSGFFVWPMLSSTPIIAMHWIYLASWHDDNPIHWHLWKCPSIEYSIMSPQSHPQIINTRTSSMLPGDRANLITHFDALQHNRKEFF